MDVVVCIDSSAAKSVANRVRLGKLRHLEVKYLWLQEVVKDRRLTVHKIPGQKNPSDVLTKPRSAAEMSPMLHMVGGSLVRRRAGPRENVPWINL